MSETTLNSLITLRRQFLGFVQRRVNDPATAEDILQSSFVRVLESADQLRDDGSAVAWFYRILRNAIIDHHRRHAVQGEALERWVRELETEVSPDPLLHEVACLCVDKALDAISPNYGKLLREVDLGEVPLASYAHSAGITPANAAVRAHRARAALRKQLVRCCGACAEHGCLDCTCRHGQPIAPVDSD